jgi:hypothetical protein
VSKIKKIDEQGDVIVLNNKEIVDRELTNYFTKIYKKSSHMIAPARHTDSEVEDKEMQTDNGKSSVSAFTREELTEAVMSCNLKINGP